jgi:hypothetical protein
LKKLVRLGLIASVAVIFMYYRSLAQIPNASFESWSGGVPTDWFTSNIILSGVSYAVNVTQATDARSGSSSAQGTVISYFGTPYAPVMASGVDAIGFPINSRPEALRGWYKLASDSGDAFDVVISTQKNGQGNGVGAMLTATPYPAYREFIVNIYYTNAETPDTAWISIVLANTTTGRTHIGSKFWVDDLSFGAAGTGTDVKEFGNGTPAAFALDQNYPNPFNPSTKIQFEIPEARFVTLKVYNLLGQEVASLINNWLEAGRYRAEFDARNLPSGTYLYRLQAGDFSEAKKMTVLK